MLKQIAVALAGTHEAPSDRMVSERVGSGYEDGARAAGSNFFG
jgi:hypothetical protein